MGTLYENILALCQERGIKGGKMCTDIGMSKGILTDLKMGRQTSISMANAQKIASYFGVSVGYLLGEETEKTPILTAKDERDDSMETKLVELYRELNEEGQEKLIDYAEDLVAGGRYIKSDETIVGKEA